MGDHENEHAKPAAATVLPLRVIGTVALAASVGTVALDRLIRRRWQALHDQKTATALGRLEQARTDLDHRIRQVEALVTGKTDPARIAGEAVRNLEQTRATLARLIRQGEEVQHVFHPETTA